MNSFEGAWIFLQTAGTEVRHLAKNTEAIEKISHEPRPESISIR
jgi:hypothetical protein